MKRTLFTLALCAASLVGTASAELEFSIGPETFLNISGEGTFEEVVNWFSQEENYAQFVTLKEDTTIKIGSGENPETTLPYFSMLQMLSGTTLTFETLLTLNHYPNTDGPMFYTGQWMPETHQGDLTLDVSSQALSNWFESTEDHTHLMEFKLIDSCMFNNTNGPVSCTFAGFAEGASYQYGNETYKNVGIITDEKLLEPGQIALLFRPQSELGPWGYGSFSLVAVGSQYEPVVPEPTTGSLSLLALAGLCARRRRK